MREFFVPADASVAAAMTLAPGRDVPAGKGADSAETILRLTEDHDRIAANINDVVVHRLFSIALTLQSARGLMDRPRAADRIELAISELDQAISDIRNAVFDAR